MKADRFDFEAFYSALDSVRQSKRLTWRQVAREAGVSVSSLTRMAQGSRPDIDTVASLATWAALDASSFFPHPTEQQPLAMAAAYLHRDPMLTPAAAAALEQVLRATYMQLSREPPSRQAGCLMTAEIAVLNRQAVALAADSAVTVNYPGGQKIYNSVNKLFTLSKYAPVGVMVYGVADLTGVPWETIIKSFRHELGDTRFPHLRDYADTLIRYINEHRLMFSDELQQQQVFASTLLQFRSVLRDVDEAVADEIAAGPHHRPTTTSRNQPSCS